MSHAPGRTLVRTLGFSVLFAIAIVLGRMTVLDATKFSLVWPATGILAVWFVTQQRSRWRLLDLISATAILAVLSVLTGIRPDLTVAFVIANIVQTLVFVVLFQRLLPGVWSDGGPALSRLSEFWRFLAVSVGSTAFGAAIAQFGLYVLTGSDSIESGLAWFTRHLVSLLVIGIATRRVAHVLRRISDGSARAILVGMTRLHQLEYLVVIGLSVGVDALVFGMRQGLPLTFALIALTVWSGIRLRTTAVVLHSVVLGTSAVLFTLSGTGPFAEIADPQLRAMMAQLFVGTLTMVGLVLALGRDERNALLKQLRESEQVAVEQAGTMKTILDAMSEGLGVIDERGVLRQRNPAAVKFLGGTSSDNQVGTNSFYGLHQMDGTPLCDEEPLYRRVLAGEFRSTDLMIRNEQVPDGRILHVSSAELPRTEDGLRQVLLAFHDVTADRRHRDELSSFAGVVAHDLLNPLTTIEGWSEALAAELPPGQDFAADSVARIQRSAARMRLLINGLLAYTTARDAGLSPTTVNLDEMVRDIATGRLDHAACTNAPIPRIDIGDLPTVEADPVLTRQLMENLIGNAIKYTAPGVVPHITVRSEMARDGFARIAVADNGIGIPTGEHEAIFQNFHRAHPGAGYAGTGLGLAICKRIVERHGGTITATDNNKGGSRMSFTLPVAAQTSWSR
jgi:signal transduction histidine kinase/integral membrane sensor domain MASE1